jgi:hypothetical protein
MDIRSAKTLKSNKLELLQKLEKNEEKGTALRAAIARSRARAEASQMALRIAEPPVGGKLAVKKSSR